MPTFRPSINTDDGYFKKVVKYIPAEIIAAYTFAMGLITAKDCNGEYVSIFPWIFFILLLFTPIYMYISVIDNPAIIDPIKKKKQAIFHAVIALIALHYGLMHSVIFLWSVISANLLIKQWLDHCYW